jgi:hypothetical protein
VLKLIEVCADNEKFRIDDGYFSKSAVLTQKHIESLPHIRFGDACSVFRKGIFDIKSSSYADEGVPFVRIGDLRDGLVDTNNIARISIESHAKENKTALVFGDIVLSKTAYAAASFVNLPDCNVSQDTIAVRLSPNGKKKLKSGFIVSYLNSVCGLELMRRQFQGNVQAHLSLPDGRKIPIPIFSDVLQSVADKTIREAHAQIQIAEGSIEKATSILTVALGLKDWQPPEPLTYTRRASEANIADRLDSEYFAPRVTDLLAHLGAGERTVSDVAPPRREKFSPVGNGEFRYIEISDIRNDGTTTDTTLPVREAASRATQYVRSGDVLTSTVRPNRRLSALVMPEQDGCVCSSGLVVLRPSAIAPEVLLTYLRLPLFCELMDLHTSASLYPAISETDLLDLPFPKIADKTSNEIIASVRAGHAARARVREFLERAKRAVEIAIEESEAAALAYLKTNGV